MNIKEKQLFSQKIRHMVREAISQVYIDKIKEEDSKYQKFFRSALKKWNVKSPNDLDDENKKRFFTYIDKNWSTDKE